MCVRELFSLKGRVSRSGYFCRQLSIFLFPAISLLLSALLIWALSFLSSEGDLDFAAGRPWWGFIPLLASFGIVIWGSAALAVQRLHDLGRSGWWSLLCFSLRAALAVLGGVAGFWGWSSYSEIVLFYGAMAAGVVDFLFCIYLLFFKGTVGSNRYGNDPLEKYSKAKIDSNI